MKQRVRQILTTFCFAGFVIFLMTGTTYVVSEGKRKVGNYVVSDGRDEVKYIKAEAPKQQPPELSPAIDKKSTKPGTSGVSRFMSLDFKINDPDLIRFLNRQPWVQMLFVWDDQYHIGDKLIRNLPFLEGILRVFSALFIFSILFRIIKLIHWLFSRKKKSSKTIPS